MTKRPFILKDQNGVNVAGGVVDYARRVMHRRQLSAEFLVVLVNNIFKGDSVYPN